jgi:SAM-dependent methyltransferase
MTPRFVARQLACPSGWMGRVVGSLMNQQNAGLNAYALEMLELRPMDRVLEVGFGGGGLLAELVERASFVGGVDRSATMIACAKARFAEAIARGHVEFREGRAEALPFGAAAFDKVCTVNSVCFWRSLEAGFAEVARVLAPGGRLVVGFMPRERKDRVAVPGDVFTPRSPDEVIEALAGAGFGDLAVARPDPARAWNLIVARQGDEAGEVAAAATMRLAPRDSGRLAVSLLEEVALQQS